MLKKVISKAYIYLPNNQVDGLIYFLNFAPQLTKHKIYYVNTNRRHSQNTRKYV